MENESSAENIKTLDEIVKEDEKFLSIPEHLLSPGGFLEEYMRYYEANSVYHYPELALMTSLVVMGTVFGNRITTETGLRTNMMLAVLAPPGFGKNPSLETASRFFNPTSLDHMGNSSNSKLVNLYTAKRLLGATSSTSKEAILFDLNEYPTKLLVIDEAGHIFKQIKSSTKMQGVPAILNDLFTKTGHIYKKVLRKGKKRVNVEISCPHLSVILAATPKSFWPSIDYSDFEMGFIPRILIMQLSEKAERKDLSEFDLDKFRKEVFDYSYIHKYQDPTIIGKSKEASEYFYKWADNLEHAYKMDTFQYAATTRVAEYASKFAILHAVSRKRGVVGLDSVKWAIELSMYLLDVKLNNSEEHMKQSKFTQSVNEFYKRMVQSMKRRKKNHLTSTDLSREFGTIWHSPVRADMLKTLIESEKIILVKSNEGSRRKPQKQYYLYTKRRLGGAK